MRNATSLASVAKTVLYPTKSIAIQAIATFMFCSWVKFPEEPKYCCFKLGPQGLFVCGNGLALVCNQRCLHSQGRVQEAVQNA